MKKNVWNLYAPFYKTAMRADQRSYNKIFKRISKVINGKKVLEIATGPGIIAKNVAASAESMIATDYAEAMIKEAKKGVNPNNLRFEVADATCLPYEDSSFDVVIIANALHIIPNPEQALSEIDRVLGKRGILIAPTFVHQEQKGLKRLWGIFLKIAGIKFAHEWSADEYEQFMKANGWHIVNKKILSSRIAMLYTECVRK